MSPEISPQDFPKNPYSLRRLLAPPTCGTAKGNLSGRDQPRGICHADESLRRPGGDEVVKGRSASIRWTLSSAADVDEAGDFLL
jgi:hypothetical protein